MSVQGERMWTPQDVSEYLGVPVATLYQWRWKKYGPPAARIGRVLRYRRAAVEAWLDSMTEAA
jgi:excisionase family DNA binding protein